MIKVVTRATVLVLAALLVMAACYVLPDGQQSVIKAYAMEEYAAENGIRGYELSSEQPLSAPKVEAKEIKEQSDTNTWQIVFISCIGVGVLFSAGLIIRWIYGDKRGGKK